MCIIYIVFIELFYTLFALSGTVFVCCVVPETKGKNAEEIRNLFTGPAIPSGNTESVVSKNS